MLKVRKYLSTLLRAAAVGNPKLSITMIKLSELISTENEKAKMKDFLNRGSRDQENIYKEPGIYEDDVISNPHPENTNTSQRYNNGYPWSFDDPSGLYENEEFNKIHQALIGREFQTLHDVALLVSRLKQAGYAESAIMAFINNYIK